MSYSLELPAIYLDNLTEESPLTRLRLINRSPEPDESGVPIHELSIVQLQIVDIGPGGGAPSVAATKVWIDGELAFDAGVVQPAYGGPLSGLTTSGSRHTIFLSRVQPWVSEQVVQVRVVSATVDGTETLDTTYAFTIEDSTLPIVTAAQASGLRSIKVQFSEAVKQVSASGADDALNPSNYAIYPLESPAVTPAISSVTSLGGSLVEITAAVELSFGKMYSVVVSHVADLHENVVSAPGNSTTFQSVRPRQPPGRSFDLLSWIPAKNIREDSTGDLRKFIACLQDLADLLLWDVDRFNDILDPDFADDRYLDLMLADLGNPFHFDLSTIDKRRLLRVLVTLYCQKGTERGVHNAVLFFLGVEATVVPWTSDTLTLGVSELGIDWVLGPAGSWSLYAFDVQVPTTLTVEQRKCIRDLVDYMKPAHTHFVHLQEPLVPTLPDHVELGVSSLGVNWDLH